MPASNSSTDSLLTSFGVQAICCGALRSAVSVEIYEQSIAAGVEEEVNNLLIDVRNQLVSGAVSQQTLIKGFELALDSGLTGLSDLLLGVSLASDLDPGAPDSMPVEPTE